MADPNILKISKQSLSSSGNRITFNAVCLDSRLRVFYKAKLRIALPNWLRDKPPDETRFCWVVRFTTVDTVKREKGMKPSPPDILIYVDAATGEIVGANFT